MLAAKKQKISPVLGQVMHFGSEQYFFLLNWPVIAMWQPTYLTMSQGRMTVNFFFPLGVISTGWVKQLNASAELRGS